jgi:hypothetical protein
MVLQWYSIKTYTRQYVLQYIAIRFGKRAIYCNTVFAVLLHPYFIYTIKNIYTCMDIFFLNHYFFLFWIEFRVPVVRF